LQHVAVKICWFTDRHTDRQTKTSYTTYVYVIDFVTYWIVLFEPWYVKNLIHIYY